MCLFEKFISERPKITTTRIKKFLYDNNYKQKKCEICNLLSIWCEKELVLQLHHKDGDNKNNKLENLQILCPNCHSQTINFNGKNKNQKCKVFVKDEKLIDIIINSYSKRQALLNAGMLGYGGNYNRINLVMKKYNLHLKQKPNSKISYKLQQIEDINNYFESGIKNHTKFQPTVIKWPDKIELENRTITKITTKERQEKRV